MAGEDKRKEEWWRQKRWWIPALLVVVGLLVVVIVAPPAVIRASRSDIQRATAADQLKAENDLRGTLVTMLGGVAVAAGTVVAALNFANSRAALAETHRQNQDSSELQRRGQVTERFSKAIDQLGARGEAEKVDIRLGGIYALEQIARDTRKDEGGDLHWPIMEILTAFIREHSKANEDIEPGGGEPTKALSDLRFKVAADTQAALTVIGRLDRARDQGRLDLSGTNLQGADLIDANLLKANLTFANLSNANLRNANLKDALLSVANLEFAFLLGANLEGASLDWANLDPAYLRGANLKGADLRGANLAGQSDLTSEELNQAICDENTRLPPGLTIEFKDWSKMGLRPLLIPPPGMVRWLIPSRSEHEPLDPPVPPPAPEYESPPPVPPAG